MDQIFEEEQAHLTETYGKLDVIKQDAEQKLAAVQSEAAHNMESMRNETSLDFSDDENALETVAALEAVNSVIDAYNRTIQVNSERLKNATQLMAQPYFAKVSLQFHSDEPTRDIYLGSVGITDEARRHFIVDWRSPVAETYYNQENGLMSYTANGRTISVDLKLRRQFDITRNTLNAYFDTTVAIEDPLLLASLAANHSEKLKAITATIQKEQNEVVRHDDVPVLLVNGIAGSGKTSVLLQRIAFLFYQKRDTLRPDQVCLLTPNPVFEKYIDNVLPDMGEANPQIFTWADFVALLGLSERGDGRDTSAETLHTLEQNMASLHLEAHDFSEIAIDGMRLVKTTQIQGIAAKYKNIPVGPRLIALMKEDLHARLDTRLGQLASDEGIHDRMLSLEVSEQIRLFGQTLASQSEKETIEYARTFVQHLYGTAHDKIEQVSWLRFDRIGMRMLNAGHLSSVAWLFLKTLITGTGAHDIRYVTIDEVQDYTEAQLMVLARYFKRAHFLLLGDENQAINEGTASFDRIRAIFAASHGSVDECRLMTSYRSTAEITALFTGLMDSTERVKTHSVQHGGKRPRIEVLPDEEALLEALRGILHTEQDSEGLCAIIAPTHQDVQRIAQKLTGITVIDHHAVLPGRGVVLLDLPLAKGLEFDHVVIVDADRHVYPDTQLARRRLYTALSRATHQVTVLAQKSLTPLLESATSASLDL